MNDYLSHGKNMGTFYDRLAKKEAAAKCNSSFLRKFRKIYEEKI